VNDAFRGVVVVVTLTAFVYAVRLFGVFIVAYVRTSRREHIARHVFYLTAGLAINVGLAAGTELDLVGSNDPLVWKEWMRLWSHLFITLGLVPLWRVHGRKEPRGAES
jgi:hypothetical protein